ncbi:MAG: zinc ABC transporter substrate-binding protein [Phycisphaerales bacterium]|nr:zinc ABC transporter substrate-binding protein [Phycisphaerales bacterium]
MHRAVLWASGVVLVVVLFALGCGQGAGPGESAREPGPVRVVVSIPPLEGLCRALLPADAEVRVLVRPGQSPHGFEPTPSDIAAIAKADLVVMVGLGIEARLPRSAREGARVVVMADALGIGGGHDEAGHEGHDHAHGVGVEDPHLWIDPGLVGAFLPALAERVRLAMERAGASVAELDALGGKLEQTTRAVGAVDAEYREKLGSLAGVAIVTQHAAWSRLADRYGLVIAGVIQVADEGEPTPGHIAEVVGAARAQGARAVFTEAQLDAVIAERVAGQIGVPVGKLDPLGQGDWGAMMRGNLEELVRTIGGGGGGGGGGG